MSRVVYVEPEEDITDLVERIRDLRDEQELVFVVPNRSQVLRSVLNLRLLQQYSRSFVTRTAVVSGDERTQQLASEAGFPTYASVAAFERGIPVRTAPARASALALDEDEVEAVPAARPAGAAPPMAAGAVAGAAGPRLTPRQRRGLYAAAGALFVVGLLLLLLIAPTATVTVVLQATPVKEDGLTVQGSPQVAGGSGGLRVLTVVGSADETAQVSLKATGSRQVPAAPATSQIVFSTDYTAPFCIRIPKGTVLAESGSLRWAATDQPPYDAQCAGQGVYVPGSSNGQFATPSKPVAVTAASPGAAGNVAAGQINQPDPGINGCNPKNYPTGGPIAPPNCSPSDFRVTNPAAAAGGVDATTLTVYTDGDVQAYRDATAQATASLTDKAKADITARQPGKVFAIDPGKNGMSVTADVNPPAPKSGDQGAAQSQGTVTVHAKAAMYSPDDVRRQLEGKLRDDVQQVSPGAVLDEKSKVLGTPTVQQAGDDGVVVLSVSGSGFATPSVDIQKLKDGFAGKSKETVRGLVGQRFGNAVRDVQISQAIPFPVLPFFSSRIEVSICVQAATQTC